MLEPIYAENLIVAIKHKNYLNWYIADRYLWIMNLEILSKKEIERYFSNNDLEEVRKNCIILTDYNSEIFINKIEKYKVNVDLLKLKILERIADNGIEYEELDDFYPTLLIDFDNSVLYSQYPEPFAYENYVPQNWNGKYESFIDLIDLEDKYWIHKGKSLLGF